MAEFRAMLAGLGLGRVERFFQSGNAVFDSDLSAPVLEALIREEIAAGFGFAPEVFVLGLEEIEAALVNHPFAGAEGNRVHVMFLRETPVPDEASLGALAQPGEGWHIGPKRFTLPTPGGYGGSKLASMLPRLLTEPMTARNLRTVATLVAMARARA